MEKLNILEVIQSLVAVPGPPGAEEEVRDVTRSWVEKMGYESHVDPKGNLLIGEMDSARIVVTAHLDEIALMVTDIEDCGSMRVRSMGGLYPWKWGEQPVEVMVAKPFDAILSFGCIHTNHPASTVQSARTGSLNWSDATVFTGLSSRELLNRGVHPGVRIALARERRNVKKMGDYLVSYFLDDRADIAAMLLVLEQYGGALPKGVVFAATSSEEVGGEGAQYLMHKLQPDVCVALEIGPSVPESAFMIDDQPTIWVTDSYASTSAADLKMLAKVSNEVGISPHWQPLSRGGSDASCAASRGLCARPITLGFPVENSHGLEIMHRNAPLLLANLTRNVVDRILAE